jgi:hypothetical protein
MWAASLEKAKQPTSASATTEAFGCRCWAFLMLAPACTASFEVGVAACILIEAHSHTLSSFRRIKQTMGRATARGE